MNKLLTQAVEGLHMVTFRKAVYSFPIIFVNCSQNSRKIVAPGQYRSMNPQITVLDQGDTSDSLRFVGLIHCLEDCGLETF